MSSQISISINSWFVVSWKIPNDVNILEKNRLHHPEEWELVMSEPDGMWAWACKPVSKKILPIVTPPQPPFFDTGVLSIPTKSHQSVRIRLYVLSETFPLQSYWRDGIETINPTVGRSLDAWGLKSWKIPQKAIQPPTWYPSDIARLQWFYAHLLFFGITQPVVVASLHQKWTPNKSTSNN